MLRDLTQSRWQEILGIPDDRIPQTLVLRGTRNLRTQFELYKGRFSDVLEIGSPNGLIEHVLVGEYAGRQVAYASVYGAAMASEVTHLFAVLGTKMVVQTGCCGAWVEGIQPGDLFLPNKAYCGEGAAQYYVGDKQVVTPSLDVSELSDLNGTSIYRGGIYTTAALFAEGIEQIEQWADDGWSAVDMETATTFAVAEYFGMQATSILFVFDNPRRSAELVSNDEAISQMRRRGNATMMDLTFRTVRQLLGG